MARQKEFDRDRVLDKAMNLFWYKGYEATSVQELVEGMGINRGSLYDTFGDKHSLFLAVLDRYSDIAAAPLQALEQADAGVEAICQFFRGLEMALTAGEPCKGCLIANAMVELALHDPQAAQKVSAYMARMEQGFYQALVRACDRGEIAADNNPRALARFFTSSSIGLSTTAKAVTDRHILKDIVDTILSVLTKNR